MEEGLFTPMILVMQKGAGGGEAGEVVFISRQRTWNARKSSSVPEEG